MIRHSPVALELRIEARDEVSCPTARGVRADDHVLALFVSPCDLASRGSDEDRAVRCEGRRPFWGRGGSERCEARCFEEDIRMGDVRECEADVAYA